jgi:hypothetical protein
MSVLKINSVAHTDGVSPISFSTGISTVSVGSGSFTATPGAATTTIVDAKAAASSKILISPTSASAAAEIASTYVSTKGVGSFIVTHPNNVTADKTWDYVILN